jgi:hypothetical protein
MIEVFKTNVHRAGEARRLVSLLLNHFPGSKINFDLDDCDKVLRVEGRHFVTEQVMHLVQEHGFQCMVLE